MAITNPIFNLRIPPDLKAKLEIRSKSAGRSITAEIIKLIEDGIKPVDTTSEFEKELASLRAEHEALKKELVRKSEMDDFMKHTAEKIKQIEALMNSK